MRRILYIELPELPEEEEKELRREAHRLVYRRHPLKKDALILLEENPGISLTKLQTLLRQQGIQRQKGDLKALADKCGFTYTP